MRASLYAEGFCKYFCICCVSNGNRVHDNIIERHGLINIMLKDLMRNKTSKHDGENINRPTVFIIIYIRQKQIRRRVNNERLQVEIN